MDAVGYLVIEAECSLSVPARILDLLTAQDRLPRAFGFHLDEGAMRISLALGPTPASRRAILVAKIRGIAGVHTVSEEAEHPVRVVPA